MPEATVTLEFTRSDETVYALAASSRYAIDGACFAACSSGLFRSRDGGSNWRLLSIPAAQDGERLIATAVAVSPQFGSDRAVFAAVKGGILRSSDGGDSWFTAGFAAPPPLFTALAPSPDFLRDGMLLAATMEDGVFSSSDRGVHWKPWNFGLFDLGVLCLAFSPRFHADETVYAGTETGLYRSTNGGRAWRLTAFPEERAPVLSLAAVECAETNDLIVIAGTESHGLLRSDDGGFTWHRTGEATLTGPINQLQIRRNTQGEMQVFALDDSGVCLSTDLGQSWKLAAQLRSTPTAILAPDADENTLLLGLYGRGIAQLNI